MIILFCSTISDTCESCFVLIFLVIAPSPFDKSGTKKMNGMNPYCNDSDTGNWITGRDLVPMPLVFTIR